MAQWTPFGSYSVDEAPPPAETAENPFRTLRDSVFDPFAVEPELAAVLEARLAELAPEPASAAKSEYEGVPLEGAIASSSESAQSGSESAEYSSASFKRPSRAADWGPTPLCVTGPKPRNYVKEWKDERKRRKPSFLAKLSTTKSSYTSTDLIIRDVFSPISDKLMCRIFGLLGAKELCRCAVVSDRWQRISDSAELWENLYRSTFVPLEIVHFSFDQTVCWNELPSGHQWKRAFRSKQAERGASTLQKGLLFKKDQIYLDVVEKLTVHVALNGTVEKAEILGKVLVRCFLKEATACTLWSNVAPHKDLKTATVKLDDLTLHPAVELEHFALQHPRLTFTPPGSVPFQLLRYRLTEQTRVVPFEVSAMYLKDLDNNAFIIEVTVKSNFKSKQMKPFVSLKAPTPITPSMHCKVTPSAGKAKYITAEACIQWKLGDCEPGKSYSLAATVKVPPSAKEDLNTWKRPPIRMECEPIFGNFSGFRVNELVAGNRKADSWVRYVSRVASFEHEV